MRVAGHRCASGFNGRATTSCNGFTHDESLLPRACRPAFLKWYCAIRSCQRFVHLSNYKRILRSLTGCAKTTTGALSNGLTESIDRRLARDRMEWARKLQRKSLTNGAIDVDSTLGPSGGGNGGGKSKGKGMGKGKAKGRGQREKPRDPSNTPKPKGICHMYVRHGSCSNGDCPYSHLSQDQVNRGLGQGGSEQRDSSRGSNDQDKGSRGRGKGRGK